MFSNLLLDPLPDEWESKDGTAYKINTSFRIGIQISIAYDDMSLMDFEKTAIILSLLFCDGYDKSGNEILRDHPAGKDLSECITWFLNGWYLDNKTKENKQNRKVIDYNVDQYRIYADFRQIYGINLNTEDMHWFEFMALLWNMPADQSSFLTVIGNRTAEVTSDTNSYLRKSIEKKHKIYDLEQPTKYSEEESKAIDDYDSFKEKAKAKKKEQQQILNDFERG